MTSESTILKKVMLKASELGYRVFRNNVGVAFQPNGQVIRYGLHTGSSDLIGWHSKVVTQDMVGKPVAVFLAIETKTKTGAVTKDQKNFLKQVDEAGGIAILARTSDDLINNRR
jgi:hypothetical protein